MKLIQKDAKLVRDAVVAVRMAQQRGDKKITLAPPPEWSLGDHAFEEAVLRELSHSGNIFCVYKQ
jgi:hypothetical protein